MDGDRRGQLLGLLRAAGGPLSGEQLAGALQVSTRTVRQYVRDLNARAREELVVASHSGYRLDEAAYRRYRRHEAARRDRVDTPAQRLYFIARALVAHPEGTHVADLAERVSVSLDTIDADLMRARLLFRAHDLRIVREHDVLRVVGSEREQRRLVRQVLVDATEGFTPTALRAFAHDYRDMNLTALRQYVTAALDASRFEVSEYVLSDLLVHLVVTADRVSAGHTVDPAEAPEPVADADVAAAVDHLADAVRTALGVSLPEPERRVLAGVLATRSNRRLDTDGEAPFVRPEILDLVREAGRAVGDYYLLKLFDDRGLVSLALHVQAMIARARAGQSLRNPLGSAFKTMHPLIHELALFFAHQVEAATGVHVDEGEVDYLSFHLGTQVQRQLEHGPPVTITCAVPRYHDAHLDVADRLAAAVAGQGVVEEVVTTLDHDWTVVSSDLIVSVVDVSAETTVPVVVVSPFLTADDVDRVREAIRAERARAARQRLRSNVLALIDPRLFLRAEPDTREAALELMCARMVAEGFVEPTFLEDVLDRERRSSTAFGRHFAVPHSMYLDALRTGISVLVTDRPIPWDGAEVRLVVLFAVSRDGRPVFRDVLDQLIRVFNEPADVTALLAAAGDHTSFVRALGGLLDG